MTATIDPSATSEYVRLVDAYPGTPHVKDFAVNERRYLRISCEIHGIIIGKTTIADGIIHYNGWDGQVWERTRSIQLLQIATPSRDGDGLYPVRIALAHIDDIEVQSVTHTPKLVKNSSSSSAHIS